MLKGKKIVLGISGSIAAYKMANLASMLIKLGADVHVVMTKNATNFINPITFETLTSHKCLVDTFDRNFEFNVSHVSLSQSADVILVAPASANVIGKMANGIADDMLTTTVLAASCKIIVAPAMNTYMYENKIVQDNLQKLKAYGMEIIEPASGRLACAAVGKGKLPDEEILLEYICKEVECEKDLVGKKVLVSAGPTREKIDPVRYITNLSTGKMGYALAGAAMLRGAEVTLVSGPVDIKAPEFVELVKVESARQMCDEILKRTDDADFVIKAAAVADYTPKTFCDEKIKKSDDDLKIELERTTDILKAIGEKNYEKKVICGFSMETKDMLENSRKKLDKKNCDMIVANNLKVEGAGFGTDTNVITIITKADVREFELMSKDEASHKVLDAALKIYKIKNGE